MKTHTLRVLGASGSYRKGKNCSSFIIDDSILIDAGAVFKNLELEAVLKIKHIFISHSHFDHIKDLAFICECFLEADNKLLNIYCSQETYSAISKHIFNNEIWFDLKKISSIDSSSIIKFKIIDSGFELNDIDFKLTTFNANHSVKCFGMVLESHEHTIVISGDTYINPQLIDTCNALNSPYTLLIECSYPESKAQLAKLSKHLTPKTLSTSLNALKSYCDLYVYHLKPSYELEIIEELANFTHSYAEYRGVLNEGQILSI